MPFALLACSLAALGLLLLVTAGPSYRAGLLSLATAFTLLRWAEYAGIGTILVSLTAAALAYE